MRFYLIPYHKTAYKEFSCPTSMKHALINQLTKFTNKLKLQFTVVLFMTHMWQKEQIYYCEIVQYQ